jgi:hypothetical protein
VLAPSSLALPTPLTEPWHPVLELESLSCPLNDASRPSSWLRPKRLPRRSTAARMYAEKIPSEYVPPSESRAG